MAVDDELPPPPNKRLRLLLDHPPPSTTTTTTTTNVAAVVVGMKSVLFQEQAVVFSKLKDSLDTLLVVSLPRPVAAAVAVAADSNNNTINTTTAKGDPLARMDLLQTASCELLQLKRFQRELLLNADTIQMTLDQARQAHQQTCIQLENVRYQKSFLVRQLQDVQQQQQPAPAALLSSSLLSSSSSSSMTTTTTTNDTTTGLEQVEDHVLRTNLPHLLKLCSDELDMPFSVQSPTTTGATTTTTTTRVVGEGEGIARKTNEMTSTSSSFSARDVLQRYFAGMGKCSSGGGGVATATPTITTTTTTTTASETGNSDSLAVTLDPNNPVFRSAIVTKLTKDLETRTQLNLTLATLKRQMAQLTNQLTTYQKVLRTDVPQKIQEMERASLPLQSLFAGSTFQALLAATTTTTTNAATTTRAKSRTLIGSHRQERLERATTLPKPLYTLFYQLSAYLDTQSSTTTTTTMALAPTSTEEVEATMTRPTGPPTLDIVPPTTTTTSSGGGSSSCSSRPSSVILKIPIPPLSGLETGSTATTASTPTATSTTTATASATSTATINKTSSHKVAQIQFEYHPDTDMITAYYCLSSESGGAASMSHDPYHLSGSSACWLGELFPGDTGEWTTRDVVVDQESAATSNADTTSTPNKQQRRREEQRRPYHWCNYLAGLHMVPQEQECATSTNDARNKMNANRYKSTQVIVHALVQRVRSMTTLQWLLQALSRKPVTLPLHVKYASSQFHTGGGISSTSAIKLASWTDETNTVLLLTQPQQQATSSSNDAADAAYRVFVATLKRKKSEEGLTLLVFIDVARYPAVPPAWECLKVHSPSSSLSSSLQGCDIGQTTSASTIVAATMSSSRPRPPGLSMMLSGASAGAGGLGSLHHPFHYASHKNNNNNSNTLTLSSSSPPPSLLYDEAVDRLIQRVNYDTEALVVESDDSTYDWILSHQLDELARGWEDILFAQQSQPNEK
jgi:hypothetical protein